MIMNASGKQARTAQAAILKITDIPAKTASAQKKSFKMNVKKED